MENKCTIAIWGRPKSGKSTLFKLLTRGSDEIINDKGVPCCNIENSKVCCVDLPYWDSSQGSQSVENAKSFENVDIVYYVIFTSREISDSNETQEIEDDLRCKIFDDINHIQEESNIKVLVVLNCCYKKTLYENNQEKRWEEELNKKGIKYLKCDLFIDFSTKMKSLEEKTSGLMSSDKGEVFCFGNKKKDKQRRAKIAYCIDKTLKDLINNVAPSENREKDSDEVGKNINECIEKFYNNLGEILVLHNRMISESEGTVISGFQSVVASCVIASFLGAGFLPIIAAGTWALTHNLDRKLHEDDNVDISQYLNDEKILKIYISLIVYTWNIVFYDRWHENIFGIEYMSGVIIPELIECQTQKTENYSTIELLKNLGI